MCVHNNNSEHRYSSQTPENIQISAPKPLKTCMCVHNNNSEHRYSSQTPENMHVCTQQQQ